MIYLLDTDTIIFMVRGLKPARRHAQRKRAMQVVERCQRTKSDGDEVGLSAITVSELEFGAHHSGDYDREARAVRNVLAPFRIFEYEGIICPGHYGHVRHELESAGTPIGSLDTLIAAHALALDATLVSNNLAHFSRVAGLNLVNWLAP